MSLAATFGPDVVELINKCKVLVVGAGGIGCELLKNLVSSGFKNIETIDLDTIEVSNLNRQFLFRKCHVGQSKAKTASSAVKEFDSSISIIGHLGNIKSSSFDSEYFNKFDIVLNALDNTEARRHVNRLCLSTKKCFVESGTQGFVGQVIPVIPKVSQCWECTPKESNTKTYPVCTIRSTPDKPVHCIVWAKLIFALLFGAEDDSNMIKDLKVEKKDDEKNEEFVKNTFIYLFERDINEQLSMEDKWKNRKKPKIINYESIKTKIENMKLSKINKRKVQSLEENVLSFMDTMNQLLLRKQKEGEMVFDKDDALAMSFVACSANLRMHCYHIETLSEFDLKGIAGNIVHAIATTNAIVAGSMVVECIKILKQLQSVQNAEDLKLRELTNKVVWISSGGRKWLNAQSMESPNLQCFICQKSIIHLTLNPLLFNYGSFVEQILQKNLGFKCPDITIEFDKGSNYLEGITEDDDEEEKKEKEALYGCKLDDAQIKIFNLSQLSIEDFSQDVNVRLVVHYLELNEEKHPKGFEVTDTWTLSKFTVKEQKEENKAVVIGKKRKDMNDIYDNSNEDDEQMIDNEPPNKRTKTSVDIN